MQLRSVAPSPLPFPLTLSCQLSHSVTRRLASAPNHPLTMYVAQNQHHPLASISTFHVATDKPGLLHPLSSSPHSCFNSLLPFMRPSASHCIEPASTLNESPYLLCTPKKTSMSAASLLNQPLLSSLLISGEDAVALTSKDESADKFQLHGCARTRKRYSGPEGEHSGRSFYRKLQKADRTIINEGQSHVADFILQCNNMTNADMNVSSPFSPQQRKVEEEYLEEPDSTSMGQYPEHPNFIVDATESRENETVPNQKYAMKDLIYFLFNESDCAFSDSSTAWDTKPEIDREMGFVFEGKASPICNGLQQPITVLVERLLDAAEMPPLHQLIHLNVDRQSDGDTALLKMEGSGSYDHSQNASPGPTLLDIESAIGRPNHFRSINSPVISSSSICSSLSDGLDEETSRSQATASTANSDFVGDNSVGAEGTESQGFTPEALKPSFRRKLHKRSIMEPRHTIRIRRNSDIVDDGHRWRKYGQKSIKNSPHPRSYYRCTNSRCPVKKQVERSTQDPGVLLVTYEGLHLHHTPNPLCSLQAEIIESEEITGFSDQPFPWISNSNFLVTVDVARSQGSFVRDVFEDLMLQFKNPNFVPHPGRRPESSNVVSSVITIPYETERGLLEDVVPAGLLDASL